MAIRFKDPDLFSQQYCDHYLEFHRVMFRFFFRPLATRVSLSSLSYVHKL